MADSTTANGLAEERTDLADKRTDYAEDRTVLANERTFAGWVRTALAAIGIGVGFHALFGRMEPPWLPRATATLFMIVGLLILWSAERRACAVLQRLDAHRVKHIPTRYLRLIALAVSLGTIVLVVGIWSMAAPGAG